MMISTKGRYALSTLIDIAKNEKENTPVSIKEIAERQGISIKYLEQIIALMVKGKLLKSIRGAKGGYLLSKEAGDILGGEILEARRWLSAREGVFVEPASAAGVAGLLKKHRAGEAPEGKTIVITATGHALKDPPRALEAVNGVKVEPTKAPFDVVAVADILDLN